MQLCARNIFITAPKEPKAMWDTRTEEDLAQLTRRIDVIKYFGPEPEPVIFNPAN